MRRPIGSLLLGMGVAAGALTPSASALTPPPSPPLTPPGPSTVSSVWRGAQTLQAQPPSVLQAVTVTVGPGGAAGLVRLRVSDRSVDPGRGVLLGDWTPLPAEPGTYTLPAPRLDVDYRSLVVALDQQTGGHAIVKESTCTPERGEYGDLCQIVSLDAWTPLLADGLAGLPPELRGGEPAPVSWQPGRQLAVGAVSEFDRDRDLAGDRTEDRTDLAVSADAVRGDGGRLTITVTNRGPRLADWPTVTVDRAPLDGWTPACATPPYGFFELPPRAPGTSCRLRALAPGATSTVTLPTPDDGKPLTVTVGAEGPDLADGDNSVVVTPRLADAPTATLRVATRAPARRGLRLRLRSERAATARATLSVRARGRLRSTTRTFALRAGAARSVKLPAPRVRGLHATGRARLTIVISAPDSEPRTLTRVVRLTR